MLSHCLVPSITKNFFAHWFWDNNQPFKYKIFNKVLQYILKLLETFLFQNMSIVMPKKYKKDRDKFWSDNRFFNWKILNYCIIIKTFWKHLFCFEQQNHVMLFKVSFQTITLRRRASIYSKTFLFLY